MRKKVIGASWKMHKNTLKEVVHFIERVASEEVFETIETFLIPSFVFLPTVQSYLASSPIGWGSQTMSFADFGAYTGEVSVVALKEFDTNYVEIGHAERREFFNESDEIVNKKVKLALDYGLTPVVCIGETKEQKDKGIGDECIENQLVWACNMISDEVVHRIIFAYEPVWAIGQKEGADANYVEKQHRLIRQICSKLYSDSIANKIRIIYGGSVKKESANDLMKCDNIDGLFIGRFGLDPENFIEIAKIVSKHREV